MNKTKRILEILKDRNCEFVMELAEVQDLTSAPFELKIKIIGELSDEFEATNEKHSDEVKQYKEELECLIRSLYPLE